MLRCFVFFFPFPETTTYAGFRIVCHGPFKGIARNNNKSLERYVGSKHPLKNVLFSPLITSPFVLTRPFFEKGKVKAELSIETKTAVYKLN